MIFLIAKKKKKTEMSKIGCSLNIAVGIYFEEIATPD
jgi:hypothetical protein